MFTKPFPTLAVSLSAFAVCALTAPGLAHAQSSRGAGRSAPFTTEVERCILPAAQYHQVNQYILRAILKVESNLNPNAVGKNDNGTLDVGIGQMNSMHFKELRRHGVMPSDLRDACVGTYVAAWHLSKSIAKHGNTWFGIAAYHSATPYFNKRYQILVSNEMVRSGSMKGRLLPVPSLRPNKQREVARSTQANPVATERRVAQAPTSMVFDSNQ
jgi:soluble lytic murein transglycosylase-like protein